MHRAKQTQLYGNWTVLHPSGFEMFKTSEKRAKWYLARDLAEVTTEEQTIRLLFEPNGQGHAGDEYYLSTKQNACVVCGVEHSHLNKHHVVPYQFRKHLPIEYKARTSYDVLVLCLAHHDEYEIHAQAFSKELSERYDVVIRNGQPKSQKQKDADKVIGLIRTLSDPLSHRIPMNRIKEMEKIVDDILKTLNVHYDMNVVEVLKDIADTYEDGTGVSFGERLVSKLDTDEKIDEFIVNWRKHFLSIMNPRFLSEHWTVERSSNVSNKDKHHAN